MRLLCIIALLLFSMQVQATTTAWLKSCDYIFIAEYNGYRYIGIYESLYGNFFTYTFTSYCPQTIEI